MRRLIFLAFLFLFALLAPTSPALAASDPSASPSGDVFIISQVRGGEDCCQPGSLDHLQYQLAELNQHNFAGSFLFRYDALTNPDLVSAFLAAKKSHPHLTAGLWIEITPSLAVDSSVIYRGNTKNWSAAEHSLLVGYSPSQRQKLLTTLINQFHLAFPDEPLLIAGAWGIDTPSLNYLESLGVKIFQSVREQWGTDSFTVDGSVLNRPYFPSLNYYLTPSDTPRDLVMIKHTITDPLLSYGDANSTFTSQPNDFNKANLTVANYFAPLLSQSLANHGWATIGLETSMEDQYQSQFGEQLTLLSSLVAHQTVRVASIPDVVDRFITRQEAADVHLAPAHDLLDSSQPLGAFWVESSHYRLRFRLTPSALILDDSRSYDASASDYYATHQAQNGFYGIIPPAFSAQFVPKQIYRAADHFLNYYTVAPDTSPQVGQSFPAARPDTFNFQPASSSSPATVTYLSTDNQAITLTFHPASYESSVAPVALPNSSVPAAVLSPEIKSASPDPATSFFDWRNPYVRVDSLPSRLILYPLNQDSFPVRPNNLSLVADPPHLSFTVHDQMGEYLFIDFSAPSEAGKYQVQVYFGDTLAAEQTLYFVHDCQAHPLQCGLNPVSWWRFIQLKIQEKFLL